MKKQVKKTAKKDFGDKYLVKFNYKNKGFFYNKIKNYKI